MNKFWLIRTLSVVTGIQRGSYPDKPKSKFPLAWILSPYALWSWFLFWFSIYRMTSDITNITNSNGGDPPPEQPKESAPNDNNSSLLGNQTDGRTGGGGGLVVVFALSAYSTTTYCTNILLRFAALIFSPVIIQIIYRVHKMCDKIDPEIYTSWSWNEIVFVVTCCVSQAWRSAQGTFDAVDERKLRQRQGNIFETSLMAIDLIIYNLSSLNSEGFPLEVACFGLIMFLTTMARIIGLKCEGNKSKLRKQSHPRTLEGFLESDMKSRASTPIRWDSTSPFPAMTPEPKKKKGWTNDLDLDLDFSSPDYVDKLDQFYQGVRGISAVMENNCQRLWELVDHYFEWYLLWMRDAEQGVGYLLLVIFLHFTLSLCLSFFIAITSSLDNGLFFFISLRNIFGVVILLIKMICLGTATRYLEEACSKLTEQIIKTHWENETKEEFDANSQFVSPFYIPKQNTGHPEGISHLIGFIKEDSLRLSALGYFTVTRSTVTNIMNVIVTYLVILLQFRDTPSSE